MMAEAMLYYGVDLGEKSYEEEELVAILLGREEPYYHTGLSIYHRKNTDYKNWVLDSARKYVSYGIYMGEYAVSKDKYHSFLFSDIQYSYNSSLLDLPLTINTDAKWDDFYHDSGIVKPYEPQWHLAVIC